MSLLAGLLSRTLGSWLFVPGLVLALTISTHQWWLARDARLRAEGENVCNLAWESAIRKEERDAANRRLNSARDMLEEERQLSEGLKNDLHNVRSEISKLRHAPPAIDSSRCLSDSVLQHLRGRRDLDPDGKSGAGGS